MYTSPDDARSDLFLSGAVYLFGPLVLSLVLRIVPLDRIPVVHDVLAIGLPLVLTVLVPYLLIRYRGESLSDYGLGGGPSPVFGLGALIAVPIVVASVLAGVLDGVPVSRTLPLVTLPTGGITPFLSRLTSWIGVGGLAVYGTVKARDAFRSDFRTLRQGSLEIGKVLAIVAVVSTLLLVIAVGFAAELVLFPLGVAGCVLLALRSLHGPSSTSRPVLLTPVILLALGPFTLALFNAFLLVTSVWRAALAAGIGLSIGMLQESKRSALGALGLTLVAALFSGLRLTHTF